MEGEIEIGLQQFKVSPTLSKGNYLIKVLTPQDVRL